MTDRIRLGLFFVAAFALGVLQAIDTHNVYTIAASIVGGFLVGDNGYTLYRRLEAQR
jgi:hypothetical protein